MAGGLIERGISVAIPNLDITNEQLRTIILEAIRRAPGNQMAHLRQSVGEIAVHQGLAANPGRGFQGDTSLSHRDYGRMLDVAWDLIIEGIIRPGLQDGQNNEWPFYHVTEFRKAKLGEAGPMPYDPDGYLRRLNAEVPAVDPVVVTYLEESLHTFRIGCLLSSTIALGCASEKALLLLVAAYANSLPQQSKEKFVANTKERMIKRQFDELRKMIDSELKARLPQDLADGLDIELTALFEFIRTQRNDAGHPTGKPIERERAYANLVVFPVYLKKVYELIAWVGKNPKK